MLSKTYQFGLGRALFILGILAFPALGYGQAGLKGNYSCNRYIKWVFNHKTNKDDRFDSPKGLQVNIRFDGKQVSLSGTKSFKTQSFLVLSVSKTAASPANQEQPYTYKLKDAEGHTLTMYANVRAKAKLFSFDFFKGDGERTIYANNNELDKY